MKTTFKLKALTRLVPIGPDMDSRLKALLSRLKLCVLILFLYLTLNILHIGCPIKALTGISCPGCGMTRATLSALQLHFREAFYYHPLFFLTPIMLLLFLFDDFLKPKLVKTIWAIIIFLFIIIYLYRLLFYKNNVVSIDIYSGLVLKLFHNIL